MKIFLVVGARPNFMKIAPLIRELKGYPNIEYKIIHTGQHYDFTMSEIFFRNLDIPKPDINLGVGSSSHALQTAQIMSKFERICLEEGPDIVIVVGDVNSTLACSLVVSKIGGIKLAHIEAGERSFDKSMPEETNRIVVDHISDYLFCATQKSYENLKNEGLENKAFLVGNIIIDNLLYYEKKIELIRDKEPHILLTIHRESNTNNLENLQNILIAVSKIKDKSGVNIIFPIHPRTAKQIEKFNLFHYLHNIDIVDPMSYLSFLKCMKSASLVLTDSGGIQVETTVLNIPCLTLRDNTEWIFTLSEGTNQLVGTDIIKIINKSLKILYFQDVNSNLSEETKKLLDGNVSNKIINILVE